jgi:hypothetical protein
MAGILGRRAACARRRKGEGATMPEDDAWDRLADACLVSGRADKTIQAWCASGEIRADEHRVDRGRRQGSGHAFWVKRSALRRVHLAHDGSYWNPDAPIQRLPAAAQARIAALQERVRELEEQAARYRRVIGQRRAGGWEAVDPDLLGDLGGAPDADVADVAAPLAPPRARPRREAPTVRRPPAGIPADGRPPRPLRVVAGGDDGGDFLPAREGDRAVSVNLFSEEHGVPHEKAAIWYQAINDGRFVNVLDARKVQGRDWQRGRLKVRYVLFRDGRDEWLRRYWHLPYVRACGRAGCECVQMPAKDGEGKIIDLNAWERLRWKQERRGAVAAR